MTGRTPVPKTGAGVFELDELVMLRNYLGANDAGLFKQRPSGGWQNSPPS
jgi:hypothetical protein